MGHLHCHMHVSSTLVQSESEKSKNCSGISFWRCRYHYNDAVVSQVILCLMVR